LRNGVSTETINLDSALTGDCSLTYLSAGAEAALAQGAGGTPYVGGPDETVTVIAPHFRADSMPLTHRRLTSHGKRMRLQLPPKIRAAMFHRLQKPVVPTYLRCIDIF
jgi:hypothetical protein